MRKTAGLGLLVILALTAPTWVGAEERVFAWDAVVDSQDSRTIRQPVGVAAAPSGDLGIVDAYGKNFVVFRFTGVEWAVEKTIELPGAPRDVAHDGVRFLISMREGQGLLAVEGDRYQLRPVAVPGGAVPGVLAARPGGGFLVHDQAAGQVLELDAGGQVRERWDVSGSVTGLATSRSGGFYTAVVNPGEIRRYDAGGTLQETFPVRDDAPVPAWPSDVVESGSDLVVVDRHGHRLLVLDSRGKHLGSGSRKGWEQGLVMFPGSLAVLPDGRIAVVDQINGRVQLFRRIEDDGPS